MPFLHGLPRLVCALGGLALVGCYSPYRYAPYGPGIPTYSPQVAPSPQFGPPVGTPTPVYPDGGIPQGGTFPPASGTFPPSDNLGGSQLTPTPDPNNSFPPSGGDGFSPTLPNEPNGGLVPPYDDPNTLSPPPGGNTFDSNSTPFGPDGAMFQRDSDASQSVSMNQGQRSSNRLQLAAHQAAPIGSVSVGTNSMAQRGAEPQGYGYDAAGYRWLSGIVDFDEQRKEWVLIYDLTPDPEDAFKGQITLIQDPALSRLHSNDLIYVEGRVDTTVRDHGTGKPQYRIENLRGPLSPTL